MREDPPAIAGIGLFKDETAPGIDVGQHPPSEIDSSEDISLHANRFFRLRIDPCSAPETCKSFSGCGWRMELRVRLIVDHDFGHAGMFSGLRLTRDVGVDH